MGITELGRRGPLDAELRFHGPNTKEVYCVNAVVEGAPVEL
jgi:hypothetical protein